MLSDKPIVSLETFNAMSLAERRQCEVDINNSGQWREELAKAAGFTAEDFSQNPDFYMGANLWSMGGFLNINGGEVEFISIGKLGDTECIFITIRYSTDDGDAPQGLSAIHELFVVQHRILSDSTPPPNVGLVVCPHCALHLFLPSVCPTSGV